MKFLKNISPENWFKIIVVIYVLFAIVAGVQSYFQINSEYPQYTCYNNYIIFKQSFFHLIQDKDLYVHYYEEHGDLYKYSPAFSLFFGAFAYFPNVVGIILWNILNCLVFFAAIYYLPKVTQQNKIIILLLCLIELMTAMQNEQSNALVAGLIILAFVLLEKKNYLIATLLIMLSVYIKLFGIVAFAMFLLYPKKWKLAAYSAMWGVVLFLIPLLAVDISQLKFLYGSWLNMLQNDHSNSLGLSVMGFLNSWFGLSFNKTAIAITGAVIFCIPLAQFKKYSIYSFRLLLLCSILIWVIIFNHKAESSTFIISMAGVAIWFLQSKRSTINTVLMALAFIFVSLSPTDIFPAEIRRNYVVPYVLKAVPCIFIWIKILYDMMIIKSEETDNLNIKI